MRVDFYVLEAPEPEAPLRFACRLVEKAWRLGHRVHVHTPSEALARSLDELLWTFRQELFLPHELEEAPGEEPLPPVRIGHGDAPPRHDAELLVNLAPEVPPFHGRFPRIADVVPADAREAGRARWRRYRELGATPESHSV